MSPANLANWDSAVAPCHIPIFTHTPLDHDQPSIRILKVLASLSKGLLQCDLANGNINDDFTCLSYTRGEEYTAFPILVNSHQLFLVRQNLWDFLQVARRKYPLRTFWIDAVCIDQSSVNERNHQVAQMGAIYAAATHVIIWLGSSKFIADFLHVWKECDKVKSGSSWWLETREPLLAVESGRSLLATHDYWTRAWITQEIAQTQSLSIVADDVELDSRLLKYIVQIPWYPEKSRNDSFLCHINIARGRRLLHGNPLVPLLQELPNRHCQIPRDRIYSLLTLAAEGAKVKVHYDISEIHVVCDVMEACEPSACICSIGLVARVLGCFDPHIGSVLGSEAPFVELDLEPCRLRRPMASEKPPSFLRETLSPGRLWYTCDHCEHWSSWGPVAGEVFRLCKTCPMLPQNLYLETRPGNSKRNHVYGRFKQVDRELDTWVLDWFDIYIRPKWVKGKRLFTLRLSMSTCFFLSRYLWANDVVNSSGPIVWTKGYKQLCEPAEAGQAGFRIKRDRMEIS